jgi:GDP-L-fucose synthase
MAQRGTVFLTGGGGMVGKNILEHSSAKQWVFLAPSSRELDLRRFDAVRDFIRECKPDIVIHAAGRVGGIQANMADPVDFLVTNVDLGRNVVMAAAEEGVPYLLNMGSSCMYPRSAPNPLREEQIMQGELEPTNEGYALAKIITERLCEYLRRTRPELAYKTMIPCNLYGRHDKFSPEHSHLIPAIIYKLHQAKIRGDNDVDIWGDGTARREFMYAGDFADAVFHALDRFELLPDLMNVGLGDDHAVNEYYDAAAAVMGWYGRFVHDLSKPVGMKQKVVSIARQQAWGWQATTSLQEGIAKTYDYYVSDYLV